MEAASHGRRPGHRIDEARQSHARGTGAPPPAWVESWYDRAGGYHSQVQAAMDIAPHAVRYATSRRCQPAGARGWSFAGDVVGDQAVAWESCTFQAACQTQVDGRGAEGSRSAGARARGSIDASQAPALAVGAHGQVLVGWVRAGKPVAATAESTGRPFGAPVTLSSTTFALDLTVGYGAGGQALAAWTQGTLNPSVVGAAS